MDTKYTILLCEDEEFVARSYVRKLELEGFTVLHAHNGEEALKLFLGNKPDLVLLDLMMPIKNGFEVLEEIKKSTDAEKKKIPIVVSSNLGQKSDIETAMNLGASGFLVKSNISLKELVAKVREFLPV
jgi:DNA-binding response OmpR family regulator